MNVDPDDFRRALMLLDACEEALVLIANREARAEAGRTMKEITHQQRRDAVAAFVDEMAEKYFPEDDA